MHASQKKVKKKTSYRKISAIHLGKKYRKKNVYRKERYLHETALSEFMDVWFLYLNAYIEI